jgi:signal transduction histidine kinase
VTQQSIARSDDETASMRDEQRVYATRIETLYEHSPRVLVANVVNAGIVGAILWGIVDPQTVVAWWIAMGLMVAVRAVSVFRFRRARSSASIRSWSARFTAGSLVSGVIWGGGAVALFPPHDGPSQVLLALVVGGMGAGASSSVASHLPAFYAFLLPAVVPLGIRFAIVGDKFHYGMSLMVFLFGALVSGIGRTTHRTLVESFRLRFSNETLVTRLQDVGASLEQRVVERTHRLEEESRARVEAEQQLQHAQRLEAVGRLTGGVAHDFNNLLTVVVNSLELLDARATSPEVRALVRPALDAALRGGELTRSLLAFSRRQDLRPEVFDVREAVQRLVTSILRRVLPESIEVTVEVGDTPELAKVDPTQLEAALLNLALNARDAMPLGGSLRFAVDDIEAVTDSPELSAGAYVRVCVVDDGQGIPEELIDRVFEPFFTTKGEHGSGLGLSMVYGFARQSGGAIRLESVKGEGTTAELLLPRYEGEELPTVRRGRDASRFGRGELVLVVEDEASVRALTVQSLRSLGYRTLEASNARDALRIVEETPGLQMMMSDVVMPGELDGLELAQRVHAKRPEIALLIVSGYSDHATTTIPWPILAKPYRRDELARALRDALKSAP